MAPPARAVPRVVLLESRAAPMPEMLLRILRLHVGPGVEVAATRDLADLAPRPRAVRLFDAAHPELIVWLESAPSAARAGGVHVIRALARGAEVEVGRVRGPEDRGTVRLVALKIAGFVDRILPRPPPAPPAPSSPPPAAAASPASSPSEAALELEEEADDPRDAVGLALALAALGALGEGRAPVFGLGGGLGPRFDRSPWWLEPRVAVRRWSREEARSAAGTVDVQAWDFGAGLLAGRDLGPLSLGAELEVAARLLRAQGRARDGRAGRRDVALGALRGGIDARVTFGRNLELRGLGGLEVGWIRQRFSVAGAPVFDPGRARPFVELGLVVILR